MILTRSGTVSYCHSGANFTAMWTIQAFILSPGHRNEQHSEQPGPKLHHKWASEIKWKACVLLRVCWYGGASLISWQPRRKIYLCDFAGVLLLFIDVLLVIWHPASIISTMNFTFCCVLQQPRCRCTVRCSPLCIVCRIWGHVDRYKARRKI